MQGREEGDLRVLGQRVAERQRAMGRQFHDEAVGERFEAVVLFLLVRGRRDGVIGVLDRHRIRCDLAGVLHLLDRLIFGPHIAPLNAQPPRNCRY